MVDRSTLAEARVVIEQACEHGDYWEPHVRRHAVKRDDLLDLDGNPLPPTWVYTDVECPGGSRRVLDATPIKWCEQHDMPIQTDGGCELAKWEWHGVRPTAGFDCSIVDKLVIDGIGASNGE